MTAEVTEMEFDVGGKIPITLPDDIYGILGLRSWNVKGNSRYLNSLMFNHEWKEAVQKTVKPTTLPGQHGFYAYRLTSRLNISDFYSTLSTSTLYPDARIQVHGLVEFRGKIIEHSDSVVRGEWCRILCFFLPVPLLPDYADPDRPVSYLSPETPAVMNMKREIKESGWLKAILNQYGVPVYLTDTKEFVVIFERLLEFERNRTNQPVSVPYKETRPEIVKKIDELVGQSIQRGYFLSRIYLSRKQMREFKEGISIAVEPLEKPVLYKRILISLFDYNESGTAYLEVRDKTIG
ncbi:MAG: hypothetical protein ABIB93_03915 [Chloroflexota bacterium]